jgi:glutamate-1-semialdehyde aminotransferase
MFGKALGNGHPITAILGRKKIMKNAEDTFISSTFWTDRVGPAAALETLKIMEVEKTWEDVSQKGKLVKKYWQEAASNAEIEITISGLDPLPAFTFVHPLSNKLKTIFIIKMLKRGYLASTSVYLSSAHKLSDLKKYEADCIEVFAELSTLIEKNLINTALKTEEAHTGFQRLN